MPRKKPSDEELGALGSCVDQAKKSFTLAEDDRGLERAFEIARLNPRHRENWALMLRLFTNARYGPRGRRRAGRVKWNDERYVDLLRRLATHVNSDISAKEAVSRLMEEPSFRDTYGDIEARTVAARLTEALRPKYRDQLLPAQILFIRSWLARPGRRSQRHVGRPRIVSFRKDRPPSRKPLRRPHRRRRVDRSRRSRN
jgi:hypothetical protein